MSDKEAYLQKMQAKLDEWDANINALKAACERVNELDFCRLVEAMHDPEKYRGVAEDVMTRALAPSPTELIDFR